jgi:DNA repair protein RecN (Recombination protein N)
LRDRKDAASDPPQSDNGPRSFLLLILAGTAKFTLRMLTTLRIKNLALVADLTLELQPGYNVITGETGAGKSVLIGALNLLLGQRADRSLIRSGSDTCTVEGAFEVGSLEGSVRSFLEASGLEPCEEGLLVIKRSISTGGANRQFVNGSPASLAALASLGETLIDIHGPHEHQSLLRPQQQLDMLDAFGELGPDRKALRDLLGQRAALESQKAELIVDDRTYAQQLDLLRFQVAEIETARLQPGEQEEVEHEHRRASNAARLLELGRAGLDLLSENDQSLLSLAGSLGRTLQELLRLDPSATALAEAHQQALAALQELNAELSRYTDKLDIDPARLRALEERLDLIHSLRRKYGSSLNEVVAFGQEARRKLDHLEQRDAQLGRLNEQLAGVDKDLARSARSLSEKRRKIIPALARAVGKQLQELGFKQSVFDISLTTTADARPTQAGLDHIEFQFAPNPGEPARALRAIASSGELARVMLALKTVLAAQDRIPVLVFDEVDANVGGETANAVGEKMQQIAAKRQVLCITHLPQVAATAAAHYVAVKQFKAGRTVSHITRLDKQERVTELARMLGGQTEAARKHAEALLDA